MSSGHFLGNSFTFDFPPEEHYWNVMARDVSAALRDRGIDCKYLPFPELASGSGVQRFFNDGLDFVIAFNLAPAFQLPANGQPTSCFDMVPKKVICPMLDHPAHHAIYFMSHRQFPQFYFGTMDPDHNAYLDEIGVAVTNRFDFRQAGPKVTIPPKPMAERSIDILFSGTIQPPKTGTEILQESAPIAGITAADIDRCLVTVVEDRTTPFEAVNALHGGKGRNLDTQQRTHLIKMIDTAARGHLRFRLLGALPPERMLFVGNHSDAFKARYPQARFIGLRSYTDIMRLMADAKITFSDTINLQNSALIRHFYANAAGCAVASNPNRYLEDIFIDDESVIFCPADNHESAERLRELLQAPEKLARIAKAGFDLQQAHHTWRDRVDGIARIL